MARLFIPEYAPLFCSLVEIGYFRVMKKDNRKGVSIAIAIAAILLGGYQMLCNAGVVPGRELAYSGAKNLLIGILFLIYGVISLFTLPKRKEDNAVGDAEGKE